MLPHLLRFSQGSLQAVEGAAAPSIFLDAHSSRRLKRRALKRCG